MPIYEFYCADCHTIFAFLSRSVDTVKRPDCPRCGRPRLDRRASTFAVSRGRADARADDPGAGPDDDRLERAMETLSAEAESIDENDPKAAARLMRRLYTEAGLEIGPGMEEAMRRLEAGEDPDAVEAELGDAIEAEDPFGAEEQGDRPGSRPGRRRAPPRVDPDLYELS